MKRLIAIFGLVITLTVSCNNARQSDANRSGEVSLNEIVNNPENPTSIFLKLIDTVAETSTVSYVARGLYLGDTVGFILDVDKTIPAGINPDGTVNQQAGFKEGTIRFRRSGPESDRFVTAIGKLWNISDVDSMRTIPIEPMVFSSSKNVVDIGKSGTYNFKLFFNQDAPVPGELFFTLDTYRSSIQLQEKGQEYRSTIVHAFSR